MLSDKFIASSQLCLLIAQGEQHSQYKQYLRYNILNTSNNLSNFKFIMIFRINKVLSGLKCQEFIFQCL